MPRILAALLVVMSLVTSASVLANRSDKEPNAPLDVHSPQLAPELLAQAQQLFDQNHAALAKFEKLRQDDMAAKIDPLQVGKTYANAVKLRRTADQLMQLGETAGYDYHLRASQQATALNATIGALQALPQAQQAIANTRTRARQVAQAAQKQVPKIERMIEDEAWLKAEAELHQTLDELEIYLGFLTVADRMQILMPWRDMLTQIETAAKGVRQEQALAQLVARRDAALPDYEAFLEKLKAAADDVCTSGKHTLDGEARTGPELIAYFDTAWKALHVQVINALAIEWARATLIGEIPSAEWTACEENYADFSTKMPAALATIVTADAQRVSDAYAADLYAKYLPAVADLVAHAPGCEAPLEEALSKLFEKSPSLAEQVAAYQTATGELLRWRKRVAAEQAAARQADVPTIDAAAREWFRHSSDSAGLFAAGQPTAAKLNFSGPAVLEVGGPQAIGKPVVVNDIVALGSGTAGISRYADRIYARVPLPQDEAVLEQAREALQRDLQATMQPPLTLTATGAIRSLERGDLYKAGGTVKGVYLEGHIPRFATLPAAAALLTPLGTLPASHTQEDQLAQAVLRFDMVPQWIAGEYFFVELPSAGALPR